MHLMGIAGLFTDVGIFKSCGRRPHVSYYRTGFFVFLGGICFGCSWNMRDLALCDRGRVGIYRS